MPVKTVSAYKTSDNLSFDDFDEANQHEKKVSDSVKEFKESGDLQSIINYIIARLKAEQYSTDFDPKNTLSVYLNSYELERKKHIELVDNYDLDTILGRVLKETLEHDYKINVVDLEDVLNHSKYDNLEEEMPVPSINRMFVTFEISPDNFYILDSLSKKEENKNGN